ncbi:hypothetical protein GOBAR_DD12300 [Gossypium barbadense]|nr:hypothetical protein GOBAR_DD12300 [Gossypium barbadense]
MQKKCPYHQVLDWQLILNFYPELRDSITGNLDVAANGVLLSKSLEEAISATTTGSGEELATEELLQQFKQASDARMKTLKTQIDTQPPPSANNQKEHWNVITLTSSKEIHSASPLVEINSNNQLPIPPTGESITKFENIPKEQAHHKTKTTKPSMEPIKLKYPPLPFLRRL